MSRSAVPLLTRRYVVALATVAALAVAGQALIQVSLSDQAAEGRVINLAGRQRMLSQRAAKAAFAAASAPDAGARAAAADELRETLATWTRAQRGLRDGDAGLGLPGQNSAAVAARLDALAPDAARLADAGGRVLDALDAGGAVPPDALRDLLAAERAYLPQMNAVVFEYDAESAAAVRWLRAVEGALLAVTLVVLLLEGLFVFRPVVARVRQALGRLERANVRLSRTNADLVAARERGGAAERAKAAILANMSHEVRTPITGILGYVDVLREETDGRFDDLLDPVERAGRRLLGTVGAVIDLAQLEAGAAPPGDERCLDVGAVAADVVASHRAGAEAAGLSLRLDAAPSPAVRVGRAALVRALSEVVGNAVRFTESGGVTVQVRPEGGVVEVRVVDTGRGMDPEFLPLATEPFEQASTGHGRSHEGTGLGLAVAALLVRSAGGTVDLESEVGRGTTVAFRFEPAPPGPPAETGEACGPRGAHPYGHLAEAGGGVV